MIWLALVLVILQRVFDLCLAILSSLCYKYLRRIQNIVISQTNVEPSARDDRVSIQTSCVRKYYAVRQGFRIGLYTSWANCEREVKGFSNAKYKSFKLQGEAE